MSPILEIQNLTHIYSAGTPFEHTALEDVSFSVNRGEFIGIIGHTGSGKSTLMQHLNGLMKPTSGQVILDGVDIWSDKKVTRQARFRVGLVFQYPEYQLFEETVYKDIAFGPKNMGLSKEEINEEVERINGELSGHPLSDLASKISSLTPSCAKVEKFLEKLSKSLQMSGSKREVYIYGIDLAYRQMQKDLLAPLLDALEERMALLSLMASISQEGIGVAIGSEIQSSSLSHVSVLSARYGAEGWQALIGSIGNTYMNYPRAISSLRGVAECLSDFAFQQFPSTSIDRSFNGE